MHARAVTAVHGLLHLSALSRKEDRLTPRHVTCVGRPRKLSHRDMLLGPSQHEGTARQLIERHNA
jgi:hypothetical protein